MNRQMPVEVLEENQGSSLCRFCFNRQQCHHLMPQESPWCLLVVVDGGTCSKFPVRRLLG